MKKRSNQPEHELESCRQQVACLQKQLRVEKARNAQHSEEKKNLLTVFDGFPEPLFLLDQETRIQMLNSAAASYCHVDLEEAIGKQYDEICPLENQQSTKCSMSDMIRRGNKFSFERQSAADPDRTEQINFLPLLNNHHETNGIIFRIQDITEQKKMNEQLVLADRQASLSQLSSGVSHEIRNPLASIMLFVDILADPKRYNRSEQELEILGEVKENVDKITDIITRIFDFARLHSSNKLPVDINKLLEDILRLWTPKIRRAGIGIKLSLQTDLTHVTGNSVELQQVFSNLILNAIEAMPEGGTLTITTAPSFSTLHAQKEKSIVLFTIQDTGEGMDCDVRQAIFNPFFSTKPGQAGLGLTISYQIIKRHGGILSCNTSDIQGTLFHIELPMNMEQGKKT